MLPNFLIIGAQKAASSWVKECLQEHPDIFMYEPNEIHFFDVYFDRGKEWYELHFREWSGQAAIGEKTPEYLSHPEVPRRIQATLGGDVKLIVSLRNPVDRAYSAFWHDVKHGRVPVNSDFRTFYRANSLLREKGCYFDQLIRYLEYFSREQLLVLIFEEMVSDRGTTIASCFEFLGVDSRFVPRTLGRTANRSRDLSLLHPQLWGVRRAMNRLPRRLRSPLVRAGRRLFEALPKQRSYTPLADDVRRELSNTWIPDIKRLEGLLGRDLSIWYSLPSKRETSHLTGLPLSGK